MEISLLDTNIVLDDYFPNRKRHQDMRVFVQKFMYGKLFYTNTVARECIDVISTALSECSVVLNNLILKRHKGSKQWDERDSDSKREIVKDAISELKMKPEKFERNLELITTFLDINREWIISVSEQELRGFMMAIVPNAVAEFSNYLQGRFTISSPLYPNGDDNPMEVIKSLLQKFMSKPYNSYDLNISIDVLVLAMNGESKGEKYSRITFFTADEDFLKNLRKTFESLNTEPLPKLDLKTKNLNAENPYKMTLNAEVS